VLGRIFYGKWLNLSSAYISGISVGILLRSPAFWPFALASVLSIMSKYVLRVKGPASLEPVKLRYLRVAVSRAGDGRESECAVGQLQMAANRDLGARLDHHLARETLSHQRYLRCVILSVCVSA
jgi:hypothetical protein